MRTRSRTTSQSVEVVESPAKTVGSKKKAQPKQSSDALVASIISSIKEENSTPKSAETNSNNQKSSVQKKAGPKHVRGLPKSGRPWKETKQR